jgi:ribonuclease D
LSDTRFIEDLSGLQDLARDLAGEEVLAVDTEFLTENNYYPKLCLIQIGAPGLMATVDPLACDDLSPLAELLAGPIVMLVHAGAQDLAILRRRLGHIPERVFDTQIAAAFVGYGHSIAYSRLVEACCSVKLKHSRAYTDWARRPLHDDQLEYALDDVRYMLPIHQTLSAELAERGRFEWADDEFRLARQAALHDPEPREQWRRLSGRRATRPRELGVLRELAAWRENEARRRDRPRQRIVADRVLLEIGRRRPQSPSELEGMRGMHPREAKRSGEAIVAAVKRGLEAAEDSLPRLRKSGRIDNDPQVGIAAALADTYMKTRARTLGLAPQLLANRKDLEAVIRHLAQNGGAIDELADEEGEQSVRLLRGWRRRVAGDDVVRLLGGEIGLRVKVRKGGVDLLIEDQEGSGPGQRGG